MTAIAVSFGADPGASSSAAIPVEVIDSRMQIVWQGTTTLGAPTDIAVASPGTYLVRATLPSGQIMTSQVVVDTDQTAKATLHPPRRSPSESLGWAYYIQRATRGTGVLPRGEVFRAAETPPQFELWLHAPVGVWRTVSPSDRVTSHHFGITAGDLTAVAALDVAGTRTGVQLWVRVEWQNHRQMLAVPVWTGLTRVLVLRDDPTDLDPTPFRVLVGGSNPEAEALLGFLASGNFDSARRVGDRWSEISERLVANKIEDPLSAAVAGYFLLRAGEIDRLHDWSVHLAEWFPWLPDGAVIAGWHQALAGRWAEAERWLTEAVVRGVPLYTQGLRLLHDSLRVLEARRAFVTDAFEYVRRIAASTKWTSGVTCFTGVDPPTLLEPTKKPAVMAR